MGILTTQIFDVPWKTGAVFATGHFFRITKISYTESTEKAQRYTEMPKIGSFDEGIAQKTSVRL